MALAQLQQAGLAEYEVIETNDLEQEGVHGTQFEIHEDKEYHCYTFQCDRCCAHRRFGFRTAHPNLVIMKMILCFVSLCELEQQTISPI